jgi:hypothetical protein
VSLRVRDFILLHSSLTGQDRLLARINFKVSYGIASAEEVKTNSISSLSVVQSDLNAARSEAGSLERVFFNFNLHDVLYLGNLFKVSGLTVGRKSRDSPVDVFRSSFRSLVVSLERRIVSSRVIACEEHLFSGFGLTAFHEVSALVDRLRSRFLFNFVDRLVQVSL